MVCVWLQYTADVCLPSKLADWDDDDPSAMPDTGSRWDKVVILKHMFTLAELEVRLTPSLRPSFCSLHDSNLLVFEQKKRKEWKNCIDGGCRYPADCVWGAGVSCLILSRLA